MQPAPLMFNMDSTLVDDNPYQVKAWQAFYQKQGNDLSLEQYRLHIKGKVTKDIFYYIFERGTSLEEVAAFSREKESLYREFCKPHNKQIEGLIPFVDSAKAAGLPMAIATSVLRVNVDFLF